MKNLLLIVPLSVFLFAGVAFAQAPAAQPVQQATPVDKTAPKASAKVNAAKTTGADNDVDVLPHMPLTREILFKLLTADLAFQRGQWKAAYSITMRVAKQTRDPRIARRAAEIAISAKQTTEAMAAVKLWHDLAPHSEDATKYYLGFVLISDKLTEARPILEQRLKDSTPKVRGILMFQIQRLLAGLKDKDKAFVLLEDLLAPYQGMAEAHVALAQGAFTKGDRVRAAAEAHKALALKPDSELAILTLAQAAEGVDPALKTLADFIAANPQAREVRLAYARILLNQKKYDQARKEFELLLALQPKDTSTLYTLGVLSAQNNDPRNAELYLTRYLDALDKQQGNENDPSRIVLLLAQLADERGDTDAALKWLAQIEPQPGQNATYISAQIKRAQISAKRGNLGEARKILVRTETSSVDEQVQILLAESQIMRDSDHVQDAYAILDKGLKQFPKNPHLLYDHAMAAEKIDNLPAMEASLRQLIAIEPSNQMAYNALGYSLADRNVRLDEAYKLIDKALNMAPNDAFIMDSMGWVQFRLGKTKEAEDWLRRAYQKRPEADIGAHLGEVLWVSGRKDEALKLWRESAAKDPKNDTLKSTLKRLNVKL